MTEVHAARDQVEADMRETLGLVPSFFSRIPDELIGHEWAIFKRLELGETLIPNKYKELMGVALHSETKCRYCTLFHTEAAKLFGATEAEIQETVHYAKMSASWSVYLSGIREDEDQFAYELGQIGPARTERELEPAAPSPSSTTDNGRRKMKRGLDELSIVMQDEGIEVRGEEWGEMRVAQYTLPAGCDLSLFFEGRPDDACPCDHWGIVIEGEIHLLYTDGTEEITSAGEFYYWPPSHTAWTETGVVFITITPAAQERLVDEHLSAQA